MKKTNILNIGAGKVDLNQINDMINQNRKIKEYSFYVFLDRSYKEGNSITEIENEYGKWLSENEKPYNDTYFCNLDIFDFLDSYKFKFNKIEAYRIFEHMDYCSGEIGRLLEACNMVSSPGTKLEIIVPNSILLCNMLKEYEESSNTEHISSLVKKLIINTELTNCKADPHASIWTPKLAREYIESEGTWEITQVREQMTYASRDIYMYIMCQKN